MEQLGSCNMPGGFSLEQRGQILLSAVAADSWVDFGVKQHLPPLPNKGRTPACAPIFMYSPLVSGSAFII